MKFAIAKPKPTGIHIETVPLTPAQEKLWAQTRAKLIMVAPGFVHLWYKMLSPNVPVHAVFTKTIPTAATDGSYMLLNPDFFFGLKLGQRAFVMLHEIFHAMFNHPIMFWICDKQKCVKLQDGTSLLYVDQYMQWAADFLINHGIMEAKLDGVELIPAVCYDPKFISYKDNLFQAYAKVYRQCEANCGRFNNFDEVLRPGTVEAKQPAVAEQERPDQAWKVAIKGAMVLQQGQGKLPEALKRIFDEILEPTVSFEDYVEGFFKRRTGGGRYDFRRADRRLISRLDGPIYAPRRTGFGCDTVVIAADTSGSINDRTVDLWLANVKGVLEDLKPQRIVMMWCDAKVHRVDDIEDYDDIVLVKQKGAPGKGGTDFRPVFEMVTEMGLSPDALIYLTDGFGTFPEEQPTYPVLWGDITNKPSMYPFGEVVFVPQQK